MKRCLPIVIAVAGGFEAWQKDVYPEVIIQKLS
jgi:hypothetical protein